MLKAVLCSVCACAYKNVLVCINKNKVGPIIIRDKQLSCGITLLINAELSSRCSALCVKNGATVVRPADELFKFGGGVPRGGKRKGGHYFQAQMCRVPYS